MERIAKGSLLVRVGAALSSLVILGVAGLAYLLVADVYDTYPQLAYRTVFTVLGALIPRMHAQAKAMAVSDERAACRAEP